MADLQQIHLMAAEFGLQGQAAIALIREQQEMLCDERQRQHDTDDHAREEAQRQREADDQHREAKTAAAIHSK